MWLRNLFIRLTSPGARASSQRCGAQRARVVAGLVGALLVAALVLTSANPVAGEGVPAGPGGEPALPASVTADLPPNEINYQGYATDASGRPLNGTITVAASLYDQASGGILYWGPETHSNVPVRNGSFQIASAIRFRLFGHVRLGPVPGLAINGTKLPRQMLRPVPYALGLVSGTRIFSAGDLPELNLVIQNLSTEPQSIGLSVSSEVQGIYTSGCVGLTASGTSGTARSSSTPLSSVAEWI